MAPSEAAQRCVEQARSCAKDIQDPDAAAIKRCMPDEIIGMVGGVDKMLAAIGRAKVDFKKQGLVIESVELDPPAKIVASGKDQFAVLKQVGTMKLPQGRFRARSFMLGISKDGGVSWRFADGSALDKRMAKKVFPSFPEDLDLPKPQMPEQLP